VKQRLVAFEERVYSRAHVKRKIVASGVQGDGGAEHLVRRIQPRAML
jgi:hypothetical protein